MSDTLAFMGDTNLRARYREERDKRLRQDGNDQYLPLTGTFARYREDPHTERVDRAPVSEHSTVICIGGGFAGLSTAARLAEVGVTDVRIVEKGGDFGGTWYWNRYPGAQCDTASMVYLPLLEETGHVPTEKYVHGPEILAHCRQIGQQFDLYRNALFQTEVTDVRWDEAQSRWQLGTNRGDVLTATFLMMGTGPLHVAKLPGIPGIEDFAGHSFHTSRWDYAYTGGDSDGAPMTGLAGKRVAIIGTGATSVQIVPNLARDACELFVFQRTPSSIDVRDNGPIDPDWFAEVATPGWQQRWLTNFTTNQQGGQASEDLVRDGWTAISRRVRSSMAALPLDEVTPESIARVVLESDDAKMDEIRARVDALIADPDTAEHLKAWYRQLCKRPCFHDEYLQSFNRPNTHLVDTDGQGVERITATGVVVAGKEYPVDCVIYASGFEVGTGYARRCGYEVTGRDGVTLSEHWAQGMRTLHGMHVHGFPNMFIVQPAQGANLLSNIPHNLVESARTIAILVRHALDVGAEQVEVDSAAEQDWVDLLLTAPPLAMSSPDCTPGYYNNEGQQDQEARLRVGYPKGATAYFAYLDDWRSNGEFAGLRFIADDNERLTA
jgi:cyclohexanone monooxygenase